MFLPQPQNSVLAYKTEGWRSGVAGKVCEVRLRYAFSLCSFSMCTIRYGGLGLIGDCNRIWQEIKPSALMGISGGLRNLNNRIWGNTCTTRKALSVSRAGFRWWKALVSDWSSVCVSTFIGRGARGGGIQRQVWIRRRFRFSGINVRKCIQKTRFVSTMQKWNHMEIR